MSPETLNPMISHSIARSGCLFFLCVFSLLAISCQHQSPDLSTPEAKTGQEFLTISLDKTGNVVSRKWLHSRSETVDLGGGVPLELVELPAGKFLMGMTQAEYEFYRSQSANEFWLKTEYPQRESSVSSFSIGKYEVTRKQWKHVAQFPKVNLDLVAIPYFENPTNETLPITWVDRLEAEEFCARLSVKTGRKFRLPTEQEWEYACRAGTSTPFAFGESITSQFVNFNGDSDFPTPRTDFEHGGLLPVGCLHVANAFGIYDMHGNASEWCAGDWNPLFEKDPPRYIRRLGTIRGGSFRSSATGCRSSVRGMVPYGLFLEQDRSSPSTSSEYRAGSGSIGFRVAVDEK